MTRAQRQAILSALEYVLDTPCLEYLETVGTRGENYLRNASEALREEPDLHALVKELARALDNALWHIESELSASGWDEVHHHPTLRAKADFVKRNMKRLERVKTKLGDKK